MRVISQNGLVDVPYEMTAFHVVGGDVRMNMAGDAGKGSIMAQYSSLEKAQVAMMRLRDNYYLYKVEETYAEEIESYHPVFQFPADDEVEV